MRLSTPGSIIGGRGREPSGKGYREWRDRVMLIVFFGSVLVGIAGLATLLIMVLFDGGSWFDWDFISRYSSRKAGQAGILAPLVGSAWVIVMTAAFTIPIGVGTAVYLEEFAARNRITRLIELNISNLAGVPSIIYGVLGLSVFVFWLSMGRSVIAAALTMTLLILPIVIISSQEAIRAVPPSYRDAAFAMGATRWQVVKSIVLPLALPGVMSGVILALSRALGEAAPMLLISSIVFARFVPTEPSDEFTVLPLQILNWVNDPRADFQGLAAAAIIALLLLLLTMNSVAIFIRARYHTRA